jgi:hypothetical protein
VSLRADGARGVVAGDLAVITVDFGNHRTRWLPRPDPHEPLSGVAYLADDAVAVMTRSGLTIIDADDRIVARQALAKPARLVAVADGHGVCLLDAGVRIFSATGGKLAKVASLAVTAQEAVAYGDVLQLKTRGGNLRVTGLATLRMTPKKRSVREVDVPVARFGPLSEIPAPPDATPAGPPLPNWVHQFTRADGVDVGHGFGQVMWRAPGGAAKDWNGPHISVGAQAFGRALYLAGPDLLLLFADEKARVFTCTAKPPAGDIVELAPIGIVIDDAFDDDGAVVLRGPWGAVRVTGLGLGAAGTP